MAILNKPTGLNVLWAATGVKTAPDTSKIQLGWIVEIPPYQYQNWLDNRQDAFIAHTNQQGVPSWDPETEYQGGLSYTKGSDGVIYKCLVTNTNSNPIDSLNRTRWVVAFEAFGNVAIVQAALTQHLNNYASLSGITNIVAARNNLSVYSRAEVEANFAAKVGRSSQVFAVASPLNDTHAVSLGYLNTRLPAANEGTSGLVALASVAQAESGVSASLAINPAVGQAVYLKKSANLAGLSNIATARSNLGLTTLATTAPGTVLFKSDNLEGLSNPAVARNNLGIGTAAVYPLTSFLQTGLNLSDIPNKGAARLNLGLTDVASYQPNVFLYKTENLAGLSSPAIARDNLGLGTIATLPASSFLSKAENLSGLSNVQAARNNLGLGPAAIMDAFGIAAGGLDFTADLNRNGYQKLPSGLILQWGVSSVPADGDAIITFPIEFKSSGFIGMSGHVGTGYGRATDALAAFTFIDNKRAYLSNGYGFSSVSMYWFAIGV